MINRTPPSPITGTRVLVAPAHIRGRIGRWDNPARRQARAAWIAALPAKATQVEVGAALGIGASSAGALMRANGKPPRPTAQLRRRPYFRGLRFGSLPDAILAGMTFDQQEALEIRCSRTGETMAEALVAFWAEARA